VTQPRRDFLKAFLGTTLLTRSRLKLEQTQDDDRYRATPDGVIATQSSIYGPDGICLDSTGNLYIVDQIHYRIRRVDAKTRIITTIAGTGERGLTGDGGPATRAKLDYPSEAFVDREGNVFFTESLKGRIRKIDAKSGILTTIAGNGIERWDDRSVEGELATKRSLDRPAGIGTDSKGNLIICDATRVLKIDSVTHRMTTMLLTEPYRTSGYAFPSNVTIDRNDSVYFAEANTKRLRVLHANKQTETLYTARGESTVSHPVPDNNGTLFFIELNLIQQLDLASREVRPFVSVIRSPSGLTLDAQGNIYMSDWLANKVYRVDRKTKNLETIAGNGEPKHPPRAIL
jgi:sugar lactone lactonase YvrE